MEKDRDIFKHDWVNNHGIGSTEWMVKFSFRMNTKFFVFITLVFVSLVTAINIPGDNSKCDLDMHAYYYSFDI